MLWIAQFVSNLGTWMQTVGAQWMLVGDPRAAVLVPLVQTATTLPVARSRSSAPGQRSACAPGSAPIALADWKRSYIITDRLGTSLLRDPFTARPYVLFHVRKRVGGGLHDSEALKLLLVGTGA